MRSVFIRPIAILTLSVALAVLFGTALISANAQSTQDDNASVSPDVAASRTSQLEILKQNIHHWGCDRPQYATSVLGCRQLNAQAEALAASIDGLKVSGNQATDEPAPTPTVAVAAKRTPSIKMSAFRSRTNPSAYYRTFCVKLCDGSSIPISYSTRPGNFLSDDDRCQSSCPSSPSKLFYAPTDQGAEQSIALDGQRYSNLPNALRYKTEFVKDCRCKPEPWSKEAKTEYQRREVVATQTSGESVVAAGIAETAKIAAGGDIEIADEAEARPSASRSKDWGRYRYSNADDGSTNGYGANTYRSGTAARAVYDPRSAYTQPQPQRRRGFFLFGSR